MNQGKYKTVLCKHYGTNGTCSYGDKCQFAHGFEELKNSGMSMGGGQTMSNDGSSMNTSSKTKTAPNPSNFKIVKCKNWETTGTCKYGSVCTFAHGDTELRTKSENTQQMSENSVLMDTGFMPMNMNNYLVQDPSFLYNMMMQQQMMGQGGQQMTPDMMKQMGMPMDQNSMNMMNQFNHMQQQGGIDLNDQNNMFFQGGMPQDYMQGMNNSGNYGNDHMGGQGSGNNSNMFMGGKS